MFLVGASFQLLAGYNKIEQTALSSAALEEIIFLFNIEHAWLNEQGIQECPQEISDDYYLSIVWRQMQQIKEYLQICKFLNVKPETNDFYRCYNQVAIWIIDASDDMNMTRKHIRIYHDNVYNNDSERFRDTHSRKCVMDKIQKIPQWQTYAVIFLEKLINDYNVDKSEIDFFGLNSFSIEKIYFYWNDILEKSKNKTFSEKDIIIELKAVHGAINVALKLKLQKKGKLTQLKKFLDDYFEDSAQGYSVVEMNAFLQRSEDILENNSSSPELIKIFCLYVDCMLYQLYQLVSGAGCHLCVQLGRLAEVTSPISSPSETVESDEEGLLAYFNFNTDSADDSQGSADDSQGSADDSQGSVDDSQGSVDDSQGSADDSQGSVDDSQGSVDDSQVEQKPGKRKNEVLFRYASCPPPRRLCLEPSVGVCSPKGHRAKQHKLVRRSSSHSL